jgi:hypothetical protein
LETALPNYSGTRLMAQETWSEKFPGMIDKGNGMFRKPRTWVNKKGVTQHVNSYYALTNCCACGKEILQADSNRRKGNQPTCNKKCVQILHSKPDGSKKFKRATLDSHVLVKSSNHPGKDKTGYVPEHRLVVEQSIGRLLKKTEIVHHKNLIKGDNRLQNLVVFSSDKEHFLSHGSLNKCVSKLMELGVLVFDEKTKTYEVLC